MKLFLTGTAVKLGGAFATIASQYGGAGKWVIATFALVVIVGFCIQISALLRQKSRTQNLDIEIRARTACANPPHDSYKSKRYASLGECERN